MNEEKKITPTEKPLESLIDDAAVASGVSNPSLACFRFSGRFFSFFNYIFIDSQNGCHMFIARYRNDIL